MVAEKLYFLNGKTKSELVQTKKGGVLHIVAKSFHDNGNKEFSGRFIEREQWSHFGFGSYWNYRSNLPIGVHRYYEKKGPLSAIERYKDGKREGVSTYYREGGKMIEREDTYEDDHLVRRKEYDPSGKLSSDEEYFEDGSLKRRLGP